MESISKNTVTSFDGISIHYEVQGTGTPALVFVHGWTCNKTYWAAQVAHFAHTQQVVVMDLAGHGDSGTNRKRWTMAAFGEDVRAVIDKLGLDQVVLVGHSMGGPVCLEAARRLQDCVVGIVGVDTFNIGMWMRKCTEEEINKIMPPFHANFAESVCNWVRNNMFTDKSDPALIEKIASEMSATPPEVGLGAGEELLRWDLTSALQDVKAPIRCINSSLDTTCYFDVEHMSGVGHFIMMEDPSTFNRLLTETIKEFLRLEGTE
ncbi:MAG: alpha/beta fold hydrolase [Candidatus Hodarchaeota archaeon]